MLTRSWKRRGLVWSGFLVAPFTRRDEGGVLTKVTTTNPIQPLRRLPYLFQVLARSRVTTRNNDGLISDRVSENLPIPLPMQPGSVNPCTQRTTGRAPLAMSSSLQSIFVVLYRDSRETGKVKG